MNKIYLLITSFLLVQFAVMAQPSIQKMKAASLAKKDVTEIANFITDKKMPSLASLRFGEGGGIKKEQAIAWLTSQLQLRKGADVLAAVKMLKNKNGIEIQKIQQSYKGINVEHGDINITYKKGAAAFMQMEFYSIPDDIKTTATISEADALAKAVAYTGATILPWKENTTIQKPKATLVFIEDVMDKAGKMCLAYKFDISINEPFSRSYIYVNAANGNIVLVDQIAKHIQANGTAGTRYSGTQTIATDNTGSNYRLRAQLNGDSIITLDYQRKVGSDANDIAAVDFTDNDNNWDSTEHAANYDNAAHDVHFAMHEISDYWKLVHGRNSWDDNNGQMKSYVHVRASANAGYDNAFWGGDAMYYGDGTFLTGNTSGFLPLTSLDVSAHELGHAVCQSTAALVYQRESGALNEGLSDIWGSCVEHYSGLGGKKDNFKIGEEIYPIKNGGGLRDMQFPKLQGQPDTYNGSGWVLATLGWCAGPVSYPNDYCGVHYNSGVINKWFFLVTAGASGTNDNGDKYAVTGLGFSKSEQIVYLAEQSITANTNYAQMREACINAAIAIYGACSNEVIQVTNAWYAVGVGTTANCLPVVEFVNNKGTISEGTGAAAVCGSSTVFNVPVKLAAAASAATDITFTLGGTAVNNVDYTISPAVLNFAAGQSGIKNIIVTVINNSSIDNSKTITFNYTINAHGGNAIASANNQSYILTITDDDVAPLSIRATPITQSTIINENFEAIDGDLPTGWSTLQFTGSTNSTNRWVVDTNAVTGFSGQSAFITTNTTTKPFQYNISSSADRLLRSPAFSTKNLNKLKLSFKYKVEGEYYLDRQQVWDYGRVMYSTDGTNYSYFLDPATNDPYLLYGTGAGIATFNASLPSAVENLATVYIGIRWTNDAFDGSTVPIAVDDVLLTSTTSGAPVETQATHTGSVNIKQGNFDNYLYSVADTQLIAKITNPSTALTCITGSITSAGTGVQTIHTGYGDYNATQKVILLSPAAANTTTTYTATLYFTPAELTTWGINKTTLKILKVKEGISLATKLDLDNAIIVTPTTVTEDATSGVIAYTGNFTGFSQFLLVDAAALLPVALKDINVQLQNADAVVYWSTAQELNNKGFDVLRSYDGVTFEKVGFVTGKGSTSSTSQYSFTDKNILPNITVYYRLKQVDLDGRFVLSNIVNTKLIKLTTTLWPSPAKAVINVSIPAQPGKGKLTLVNIAGKVLATKTTTDAGGIFTFDVRSLPAGVYLVKLVSGSNNSTYRFVKE